MTKAVAPVDRTRAWRRIAPRYRHTQLSYAAFLVRLGRNALFAHYYTRTVEYPLALAWLDPRAGDTLLDVGAGDGPFPLACACRGARVLALDRARRLDGARWAARWHARRGACRGAVVDLRADAGAIPLADASVQLACSVSALEHVPGDGDIAAMTELARVLRPGGRAFVSVEAAAASVEVHAHHGFPVGHGLDGSRDTQLVRYYDPASVQARLVEPARGLVHVATWWFADRVRPVRAALDEAATRARWYSLAMPAAWMSYRRLRGAGELAGLPRRTGNHSNAIACVLLAKPGDAR